jgi:hypothetical protein
MSLEQIMDPPTGDVAPESENKEQKPLPLKSWRKKYRKLRVRFGRVIDDSNFLFKEERKALALARRLQEETEFVTLPSGLRCVRLLT